MPARKADVPEAIGFENITMRYRMKSGTHTVLENFNLTAYEGEFLSLVGPSGCGKSTVLRLAADLMKPSEGRVVLPKASHKRGFEKVAIVFQRPNLLPWLSVLSNVLYPVRTLRRVRKNDVERAMSLLETVGISKWAQSAPDELSGGMQQRVAICRALVLDPSILLMDEPFSALDALTREEMQWELRRIHQASRKTALFVTHSVTEAVLLSDRIAVMTQDGGRLSDICEVDLPERNEETAALPAFHAYAKRIRDGIYGRGVHENTVPLPETSI